MLKICKYDSENIFTSFFQSYVVCGAALTAPS